jgi:hypothetical protein
MIDTVNFTFKCILFSHKILEIFCLCIARDLFHFTMISRHKREMLNLFTLQEETREINTMTQKNNAMVTLRTVHTLSS